MTLVDTNQNNNHNDHAAYATDHGIYQNQSKTHQQGDTCQRLTVMDGAGIAGINDNA